MVIRPPKKGDLNSLDALRQERLVLLQQADARIHAYTLTTEQLWVHEAARLWVAFEDGPATSPVVGYVLAWEVASPYGTPLTDVMLLDEIGLDPHQTRSGLLTHLIDAAAAHFTMLGRSQVWVLVPKTHAVEQAYWRGRGFVPMPQVPLQTPPGTEWMWQGL